MPPVGAGLLRRKGAFLQWRLLFLQNSLGQQPGSLLPLVCCDTSLLLLFLTSLVLLVLQVFSTLLLLPFSFLLFCLLPNLSPCCPCLLACFISCLLGDLAGMVGWTKLTRILPHHLTLVPHCWTPPPQLVRWVEWLWVSFSTLWQAWVWIWHNLACCVFCLSKKEVGKNF